MRSPQRFRALILLLLLAVVAFPLAAAEKPTLVVVISVDQMRTDYLERFRPYFGKDGFERFLERGARFPQNRYRHAATFTGPGHASIGTGLDPRDHGIIANRWYDVPRGTSVYCAEDRTTRWVGAPETTGKIPWAPASPILLDRASLGDRLKEKFPGSRVVGLALKDRSAVLMAGRKADAALWFEERFERFVTSSYYPPRPSLLVFNDRLPDFFAARKVWELSGKIPEDVLKRITFDPPELLEYKNPLQGMSPKFPHPLPNVKAIVASPFGDELLLSLARFVIEDLSLGRQPIGHPDLLFLGLSSTDYYGHAFGPDSKEIADGIVRLDATLEAFFRWLDEKVGKERLLLFLTGDHGVTPIPQVGREKARRAGAREDHSAAGRVDFSDGPGDAAAVKEGSPARLELERHLSKRFGYSLDPARANATEGAVLFFEEPCLYLNRPLLARRKLPMERVKETVRDWVRTRPGVLAAYTNTEIGNGLPATAPYSSAIERSFRADRSGDIFIVLKAGWMWSYGKDRGTTHGQPHDDDARVPLLAWGAVVKSGSWDIRVSPLSIARTIAALFDFEAGASDVEVLEPVMGREMGARKVAAAR